MYKTKCKTKGGVDHFKARLVPKGYKKNPSIDYFEVFVHVTRLDTIRIIISLIAQTIEKKIQIDVKSTFLNDKLEEEVYVEHSRICDKMGRWKDL